jgi:hypothetical protein
MQVMWASEALSDHAWGGHFEHHSACLHDGNHGGVPPATDTVRAVFFGRFVAESVILPHRRLTPEEKIHSYLATCRATPLLPFGVPREVFDRTWVYCNGGAIPIPSLLQQLHAGFGSLNNHKPGPGRRTAPLHFRFFEYMLREKLGLELWTGFFSAYRMHWDEESEVKSYRGFFRSLALFAPDVSQLAPTLGALGYMRVPAMEGSEVLAPSRPFDPKARYSLPLRIGRRPPGRESSAFPDWICWKGDKRGKEREKAVMCASVVKDAVLAVGFDRTQDGKVRVYRNPEDIDELCQVWKDGDGNMAFFFAASWAVCNLRDLLQLKKRLEDDQKNGEGAIEEGQEEGDAVEQEVVDNAEDAVFRGEVVNGTPSLVNPEEQHESSEGELFVQQ